MGDDLYALEQLLERFGIKYEKNSTVAVANSQFVTVKTGSPKVSGKKGHCVEYHFDGSGKFVGMGVFKDD